MLQNLSSAAVVIICLIVNGTLFFQSVNDHSQLTQMKKIVINFLMTIHVKYQVFGFEKQDFFLKMSAANFIVIFGCSLNIH